MREISIKTFSPKRIIIIVNTLYTANGARARAIYCTGTVECNISIRRLPTRTILKYTGIFTSTRYFFKKIKCVISNLDEPTGLRVQVKGVVELRDGVRTKRVWRPYNKLNLLPKLIRYKYSTSLNNILVFVNPSFVQILIFFP